MKKLKPTLTRRQAVHAAGLCLLGIAPLTQAQNKQTKYPSQPVKIIVPFSPGGTSDIICREMADRATRLTGQTFIVENKAGASGAIGLTSVAKASPDGYTLLMGNIATQTIAPHLNAQTSYNTLKDFAPVILTGRTTNVIVVHPSSGIKNFSDLTRKMQSASEKNVYATGANGGSPHLSFELLKQQLNWHAQHVAYKGAGPMIQDLLGGHVSIAVDNLPTLLPYIRRGNLIPIAVTSAQRWPGADEIPTLAELGVSNYDVSSWFGLFAPGQTPSPILNTLAEIFTTVQNDPVVIEKFRNLGARIDLLTLDAFGKYVAAENSRWMQVIKLGNIKNE